MQFVISVPCPRSGTLRFYVGLKVGVVRNGAFHDRVKTYLWTCMDRTLLTPVDLFGQSGPMGRPTAMGIPLKISSGVKLLGVYFRPAV